VSAEAIKSSGHVTPLIFLVWVRDRLDRCRLPALCRPRPNSQPRHAAWWHRFHPRRRHGGRVFPERLLAAHGFVLARGGLPGRDRHQVSPSVTRGHLPQRHSFVLAR
jgi:hypothetical protein